MAETIDQLLVSLGLETDAKSFQAANDAMKSVKDGILQLAATNMIITNTRTKKEKATEGGAIILVEMRTLNIINDASLYRVGCQHYPVPRY